MDLTALRDYKSPNFNLRGNVPITHIVIHAMMGYMAGTAQRFCDRNSKVSAHYGVGRDGSVVRYVADESSAWHVCRANPFCLGVEHEDMWHLENVPTSNIGGCMGKNPWMTPAQRLASVDLVSTLMIKYNVPIENVIGHNDPYLRQFGNNHADPGPLFPWLDYKYRLREALITHQTPKAAVPMFGPGSLAALPAAVPAEKPRNKGGRPKKGSRPPVI